MHISTRCKQRRCRDIIVDALVNGHTFKSPIDEHLCRKIVGIQASCFQQCFSSAGMD